MIEAKVPEGLPKWMSDHVDRYLKSGGKDGHMYTMKPPGMDKEITVPALLLVTKGRKSGEKYLFPLFYGETGKSYYIVASKGGADEHPDWYLNIRASEHVDVQIATQAFRATWREPEDVERHKVWDFMAGVYPPYITYQRSTARHIPVIMMTPVETIDVFRESDIQSS